MNQNNYSIPDVGLQGDQFLPIDRIILILAIVLIFAGVVLFLKNPLSLISLRNLTPIGKIEKLELDSKRKILGTLSWVSTKRGDVLYNGDQILTNEDSYTTVQFDSGDKLVIGPLSLIKLEIINNEFQVQLVKGQVKFEEVSAQPIRVFDRDTGKELVLKKGVSHSTPGYRKPAPKIVEEIRPIEVLPVEEVKPMDVAKVEPKKVPEPIVAKPKIKKLAPPKIIQVQLVKFVGSEHYHAYEVHLMPYKNAKTYYLEVFADSGMKRPVHKISLSDPYYKWLTNRSGKYFYRVKIKDRSGQVSPYSERGELVFPISPMIEL